MIWIVIVCPAGDFPAACLIVARIIIQRRPAQTIPTITVHNKLPRTAPVFGK
jgi:hypothetical protein